VLHTKVVDLVENNGFFRGYLSIHSRYRILPSNCNVVKRHGNPRQKHGRRSPCGTTDKGSQIARFGAIEVLLAKLIARVYVVTVSGQDETHLLFIYVATASIIVSSLAEPRELPELADVGKGQVCFQGIFRNVVEGKVIFKDKAVHGLSLNR